MNSKRQIHQRGQIASPRLREGVRFGRTEISAHPISPTRGNIAIDTMFIIVISLIGILFMLAMFSGKIPAMGKDIYCKTFYHLQASSLFPESIRAKEDYCPKERSKAALLAAGPSTFHRFIQPDGTTTVRLVGTGALQVGLPEDAQVSDANLTVFSKENLTVEVDVGADGTIEATVPYLSGTRMPIRSPAITHEVYLRLTLTPKPCAQGECVIPIRIIATPLPPGTNADLAVSAFDVTFKSCALPTLIVAQMLACDERSAKGTASKSIVCGEIAVPGTCQRITLGAAQIAEQLRRAGACESLPLESQGCGSGEEVLWGLSSVGPKQNILIEYQSGTKQIAVS